LWCGRQSFSVMSEALTRDASTIVSLMTIANQSGITPQQNWETIYLPTVFFVGKSDDLTFYEYRASLQSSFGDLTDLNNLTDTQKWSQFYTAVQNLQGPSIMGEAMIGDAVAQKTKSELQALTKGFRFMGQRFIPDSYMFSTLTQGAELPDPVTGQSLPSTPTALMIMTLLGSAPAQTELDQWIAQSAPNSDKVIRQEMDKLDTEFKALTQADWTQNIYWTWLYTLKSLFVPLKDGYPSFMQSPVWEYKNLNTALGSWTELRHDTLLYAKQSYAELGGGGEPPTPPPVPKGYVEPNPQFFERLIALVKMTSDGLTSRDLIHPEYATRLNSFQENLSFLQKIMIAQLENKPISDDDFEKLRKIGYLTSELVYPLAGDIMLEKDARTAIIADVHTDIANGTILYEATGKPKIIYTAIKDINGTRLVRGVIYSYYEFNNPLGTRLSDETWQEQIYQSEANLPQPPSWYSKFGP